MQKNSLNVNCWLSIQEEAAYQLLNSSIPHFSFFTLIELPVILRGSDWITGTHNQCHVNLAIFVKLQQPI
jgi:hypothetical protein